MEVEFEIAGTKTQVQVDPESVTIEGNQTEYTFSMKSCGLCYVRFGTEVHQIYDIQITPDQLSFTLRGNRHTLPYKDEQALLLAKLGFKSTSKSNQGIVKSPMPGKILRIRKQIGDTIETGEPVIILEAMKMENELKSPVKGTITAIHVSEGPSVEKNTALKEIQ